MNTAAKPCSSVKQGELTSRARICHFLGCYVFIQRHVLSHFRAAGTCCLIVQQVACCWAIAGKNQVWRLYKVCFLAQVPCAGVTRHRLLTLRSEPYSRTGMKIGEGERSCFIMHSQDKITTRTDASFMYCHSSLLNFQHARQDERKENALKACKRLFNVACSGQIREIFAAVC